MAQAKEIFQLKATDEWPAARADLNPFLLRLLARLDQMEGRSGTPTFYSAIDMGGFAITDGPSPQTPASADFITKAYADGVYGPSVIRSALQVSGAYPLAVNLLPGAITTATGTGTTDRIVKFNSPTELADSAAWSVNSTTAGSTYQNVEIGTTTPISADSNPLYVRRDYNGSTDILSVNTTSGGMARSTFRAVAGGGADIYVGVTSSLYTLSGGITDLTGFIYTGTSATAGLIIQAAVGPIQFQSAGVNTVAIFKSLTPASTYFNLEIGTNSSTGEDSNPLYISRQQDGSTDILVVNIESSASARSTLRVLAGGPGGPGGDPTFRPDCYFGVTSYDYTGGGGLSGANAFIVSSLYATAGLAIQTTNGPIRFNPSSYTTSGDTKAALFNSTTSFSLQWNFEVGTTSPTAADENPLYVRRDQNLSTDVICANVTSGTAGRASFRAVAGGGSQPDIYIGITSDTYNSGAGTLPSSAGFIFTGAGSTGGMIIQTASGAIAFQVAGTATFQQISTDDAYEFVASSTAAVGAAGRARLRNSGGTLQLSNNGGAYASIASGGTIAGSGTTARIPKFTAATTIGDSVMWDVLSSTGASVLHNIEIGTAAASGLSFDANPLLVERDQNASTDLLVYNANNTGGGIGAARSAFRAVAKGASNPDIYMGVTSSNYQTAGGVTASTGFFYTGANTSGGLVVQTAAGPIVFQPAGSTTKVAIFLSTTGASTFYNLEIGTTAATGADANPLYVRRDQNTSTDVLAANTTSGTTARTSFRAVAGGGSPPDIYMGVTSAAYTTAGGVAANTGFFYTGANTAGGMVLQTAAGAIVFQAGGTTTNFTFATSGLLTATHFADGTVTDRIIFSNGTNYTNSGNLTYDGDLHVSGGNLKLVVSGAGVYFAGTSLGTGTGIFGTATSCDGYIGGKETFAWIDSGTSTTLSSIYILYNNVLSQVKFFDDGGGHKVLYV